MSYKTNALNNARPPYNQIFFKVDDPGKKTLRNMTDESYPHPNAGVPPHFKNFSLGELYAATPRDPIVKPVKNKASLTANILYL